MIDKTNERTSEQANWGTYNQADGEKNMGQK